jgi:hypothetical protein
MYGASTKDTTRSIIIGGFQNYIVDSAMSTAIGQQNEIDNADYALAIGKSTKVSYHGGFGRSVGGFFGFGDGQIVEVIFSQITSDALGHVRQMNLDEYAGSKQLILANNKSVHFKGTVVAHRTGAVGYQNSLYDIEGLIRKQGTSPTNVTLKYSNITPAYEDDTLGLALSANTTSGYLAITVSGIAGRTYRWLANLRLTEITG